MIDNRFEQYWRSTIYRPRLRYKLIISAILHVAVIGLIFGWLNLRPEKKPPEVFQVQIVQSTETTSDTPTERVSEQTPPPPEPEPAPTPEPEPPAPEPEPVPPPPAPEPEPAPPEPVVEKPKPPEDKPAPKPKPPEEDLEAKKKAEAERKRLDEEKRKLEEEKKKLEEEKKRVEEEKKRVAEEKKRKEAEEKKKLEEEKKRQEKEEEAERKKMEAEKQELERLAQNKAEETQGIAEAQLPVALSGWAALVQRKVDRNWVLPAGISLGEAGETIKVGFVVASTGDLMDGPTILVGTTQQALDTSCLNAIKASFPLPPFPPGFNEPEQYVVYVFRALP